MELATGDAFREINFKFDDDITSPSNNTVNTEVVIHRKKRPLASREEEDFRRNCREMNTSTPKKSDVKLAINEARSSFFGLDTPPQTQRRDSQMDTAELLAANCTEDSGATRITANSSEAETEDSCRSCDINNNSNHNTSKTKSELESGLGSISDATLPGDEPDAKICPERELLLENDDEEGRPVPAPRNIIREPQYYKRASQPNPTQVRK